MPSKANIRSNLFILLASPFPHSSVGEPCDGGAHILLFFVLAGVGGRPWGADEGEDHHEEAEAEAAVVDEDETLPVSPVKRLLLFRQGGRGVHLAHEPQHKHDGVLQEHQYRIYSVWEPSCHLWEKIDL